MPLATVEAARYDIARGLSSHQRDRQLGYTCKNVKRAKGIGEVVSIIFFCMLSVRTATSR